MKLTEHIFDRKNNFRRLAIVFRSSGRKYHSYTHEKYTDTVQRRKQSTHSLTIIKVSLRTKREWPTTNAILCCTPTSHSSGDDKDQFCRRLQSIVEKCSEKELNVPMEDLNIRVGLTTQGMKTL